MNKRSQRPVPPQQWLLRSLGLAGVLMLILGMGLAAGLSVMAEATDGLEGRQGVAAEAARRALRYDATFDDDLPFRSLTRARVEQVEPSVQGQDDDGQPLRCTDDPGDPRYYSVTVRRVGLFGTTYGRTTYRLCNVSVN